MQCFLKEIINIRSYELLYADSIYVCVNDPGGEGGGWVCERAQKDEQMKSRKCSIFVIASCLKDSAFITVKRDAKF